MSSDELQSYEKLDAQEIWEHIFLGKIVEVEFTTQKAAEQFRVRLHQIKASKEKQMLDIGFLGKDEVQSLLWVRREQSPQEIAEADGTMWYFQVSLGKRKRESARYSCRIIEPTEERSV